MKRLTTDNPKDNIENALNLFYAKDGWTWVRGGGPAPDYADMSLCDFVRMLVKANIPDAELPEDNDDLSDLMCDWLIDEPDSTEGIISLLYTAGWAFAELRHRLAAYEDTGLEPEEIKELCTDEVAEVARTFRRMIQSGEIAHLQELLNAEQDGRLVVLPCKVGDAVYVLPIGLGLEGDFITEAEVFSVSSGDAMFRVKYKSGQLDRYTWSSIGKTVFLTSEEAERALEMKKGEQENAVT